MCLYPKIIINKKYQANKKNGGIIPIITDERTKYVPIGCQNCIECRKQKARSWQVRLLEDIKEHKNGRFITLTFNNKSYAELNKEIKSIDGWERDNEIATLATRRFLERWRKKYKVSLRHWLVTELGHNGTENIHMHGIVWCTDTELQNISEVWNYGYVWKGKEQNGKIINYVNDTTIGYITKYVTKMDTKYKTYKAKILTSPGIGKRYTTTNTDSIKNGYNGQSTIETYRTTTGHKIGLPIYWRNKIYTEEEREALWIQKLDKEERWIRGEKISIKYGDKAYYNLLKWHRAINKELGYGDDEKNWTQVQYDRERRNLKRKERINKAWQIETRRADGQKQQ